jgi:hypothetical protein
MFEIQKNSSLQEKKCCKPEEAQEYCWAKALTHSQCRVAAGIVRALVLLALLFCFKRYFDPLFVHNHNTKST